ncbi:30899_t:CDS:2, partial [Gigaspora margarita]
AWKLVKKKTKNEIDDKIKEYLTISIPIQSYVSQPFSKSNTKKLKRLYENQKVVVYNSPGRPPLLFDYPDLHEHIHDCIKFERCIVNKGMKLLKYGQLAIFVHIAAKAHHHPALIAITSVFISEKKEHINKYYCLALVKGIKQFVAIFSCDSVIISQDDKAKVLFGIPAIGKTFQSMQTINEAAILADYDFPIETHQN